MRIGLLKKTGRICVLKENSEYMRILKKEGEYMFAKKM